MTIPPGMNSDVYPVVEEFMRRCYDLFGAYLDALAGLNAVRRELIEYQQSQISLLKESEPTNASEEVLDRAPMSHEFEAGVYGPQKLLHRGTQGQFKERTAVDGVDAKLLGHMTIALLYGLWEDQYREALAVKLGHSDKNDLMSDLFGDIGKLRNAIVHNAGIATDEVARAKILKWFKRGDAIFVSVNGIDHLFDAIDTYMTDLCCLKEP